MPAASRNIYTSSTHTRVLAAFYTDEPNGLNIDEPVMSHPRLGKIIGFQYQKQLGTPSGTWQLTIKKPAQTPQSQLRRGPAGLWLDPEDVWVRIKVAVDGQIIDTVLGLIDSVKESTTRTGVGQRQETYTITGRDIGKILETTELFVNFFHDPSRPLRAQGNHTSTMMEQLIGTPAHFVRVLIETWLGNDGTAETPWLMPSGLGGGPFFSPALDSFGARLHLEGPGLYGIQPMRREDHGESIAPTLMQIDQTGGSLWQVMQEYSNGLLNEMFVDLAPSPEQGPRELENLRPTLTLRERPFPTREGSTTSRRKWNQLTRHVLAPGDVKSRNLAKGGAAQRYNYWKLQLSGIGSEGFNVDELLQHGVDGVESGRPGNIPIFNTESIARHGVRMYNGSTRFIPFLYRSRSEGTEAEQEALQHSFFRLCARWLKKIHDWFVIAPYEVSGTLGTSRMFPEIRIGQRVDEERVEGTIHYYVEGISHSWTYPNAGETTLTLTRGEYEGDELLDLVYDQYENPNALGESEVCPNPDGLVNEEGDLIEQLAAGCRFEAPVSGRALIDTESGLTEEFTVQGMTAAEGGVTTLEVERDGTTARDARSAGAETSLDETDASQGDADTAPAPDAQANRDMQQAIDREEPLPLLDGLDDLDDLGNDPLGGLDLGELGP